MKTNSPTFVQLLENQFFKEFAPNFGETLKGEKFNFPVSSKEAIQKACVKTEQKLKDEQKLVKSQKRVVRVYATEEEKKKQNKHKVK
jgi:PX domain-containing protein kinase-like protein